MQQCMSFLYVLNIKEKGGYDFPPFEWICIRISLPVLPDPV